MKILSLNAGSSSLKYALFEARRASRGASRDGASLKELSRGHLDNHGKEIRNFEAAVEGAAIALVREDRISDFSSINAVGHRVVHGGERFIKTTKITPAVLTETKRLIELAPLHNKPNIECIIAARKIFPRAAHVAIFDTSFHHTMPEKAYLYGLPYSLSKKFGVRRFGFHGTSHAYVFGEARKKLGLQGTRRVITCHLGNGCSLAAIKNGKIIDTSMGFTPLEGIPMGTRSGDLDPSIVLFLLEKGYRAAAVRDMLNHKSGLLGVSELSSDVRDLWAKFGKGDERARRALEWFSYRIAKYIGAYAVALGGIDCVVFTGGIGENAGYIREWIMKQVRAIASPKVLVIKTDEERRIAEETARTLNLP